MKIIRNKKLENVFKKLNFAMLSIPIFTLAALFCTFLYFKQWKRQRIIGKIPGPKGYPIIGNTIALLCGRENVLPIIRKWSKEYFPIYKYWILNEPVINLLHPDDIEIIMSSTKHSTKGIVYDILHPWLGTGLLTSAGSKWYHRRKILTPAFHFNILQQFLKVFIDESELLVQLLEVEVNKEYTDIDPIVSQFTLKSICETAMGTRLDKNNNTSREYIDAISGIAEIFVYRLTRPWFISKHWFEMSSMYKKHNELIKILHDFTDSVIKKREINFEELQFSQDTNEYISSKRKKLAMLDLLISAKNSENLINDGGIREEVNTFMFEGHDTTATCISFTLFALACHEDIQQMVYEECQEVISNTEDGITISNLQKLTYLEMVIKESLRMFPSVPYIARVTDEEIQTATGYTIPKHSTIQIHIFDVHRNPEIYPNPEKFDPDRFSQENSVGRHHFAYIPFSAGTRNCIGQKFAMLEVKTALVSIINNFVLKSVDNFSNLCFIPHLVLKTKYGIKIKFCKRNL